MRLRIDPPESLVDAPPVLWSDEIAPGSEVAVEITTVDAAGHRWRSRAVQSVQADGCLGGGDPGRAWWDMAFDDATAAPVALTAPEDALDFDVTISAAGGSAAGVARRRWGRGVTRDDIVGQGWRLPGDPPRSCRGGARAFAGLPGVDAARLGVLAVSVGTGVALSMLAAPGAPAVRAVVAASPTHVR